MDCRAGFRVLRWVDSSGWCGVPLIGKNLPEREQRGRIEERPASGIEWRDNIFLRPV